MTAAMRILLSTFVLVLVPLSGAHAQSLLDRLERRLNEAGVAVPAPRPTNRVERVDPTANAGPGYLGLTADTKDGGVEVLSVRAGGPADDAGILPGDRIKSIGGVAVAALDEMQGLVGDLPAGSRVDMVVTRGGREQKIALTVGPREGVAEELPGPRVEEEFPEERPLAQRPASLGVRALPVTADLQRRYGLTVRRGAVIENIQPNSPAHRYGLPVGGAIVAVDGVRVDSPDDLAMAIGGARPGDSVEISFYQRDQVFRKQVRLGPSGPAPVVGEDRPLLRRLERAIQDEPAADRGVIDDLQSQIDALKRQVNALEARLEAIEGRDRPAKEAVPEEPSPEKTPELKAPLKPLEP